MEALERLTKLLAQQHSLQRAGSPAQAVGSGGSRDAQVPPPGAEMFAAGVPGPNDTAYHPHHLHHQSSASLQELPTAGPDQAPHQPQTAVAEAQPSGIGAMLAALINQHQSMLREQQQQKQQQEQQQQQQQQQQREQEHHAQQQLQRQMQATSVAATPVPPLYQPHAQQLLHAIALQMSIDGAASGGTQASVAGMAAAEADASSALQGELAKAVAQVVVAMLHKHPDCVALKHMGAVILDALLQFVAPGRPGSAAVPLPPAAAPTAHHALLSALLQPAAPPPASTAMDTLLLRHLAASAGLGGAQGEGAAGIGRDAHFAAALQDLRQNWPDPSGQRQAQLFRPQAVRMPSGQQGQSGPDHVAASLRPHSLMPMHHGGAQMQADGSPAIKRQRIDYSGYDMLPDPSGAQAGSMAGTLPTGGGGTRAQPGSGPQQAPPLVPLLQGPGPQSPAVAEAAAAAASAAAALRPLAAREQAIPRQVPATLRRDSLAQSLKHPLAAVDRLLTNATYMNRLHVNQSMAHDLLPDVEEIVLPKDQQRQGTGGSLMLFKHSIVVVDESDRAWPVQYEGFMSAGQRHLRLGAGWRYLCRANSAAVGDTLVLERWTQDRSVVHLRIVRAAHHAQQARQGQQAAAPPPAAVPGACSAQQSQQVAAPSQPQEDLHPTQLQGPTESAAQAAGAPSEQAPRPPSAEQQQQQQQQMALAELLRQHMQPPPPQLQQQQPEQQQQLQQQQQQQQLQQEQQQEQQQQQQQQQPQLQPQPQQRSSDMHQEPSAAGYGTARACSGSPAATGASAGGSLLATGTAASLTQSLQSSSPPPSSGAGAEPCPAQLADTQPQPASESGA